MVNENKKKSSDALIDFFKLLGFEEPKEKDKFLLRRISSVLYVQIVRENGVIQINRFNTCSHLLLTHEDLSKNTDTFPVFNYEDLSKENKIKLVEEMRALNLSYTKIAEHLGTSSDKIVRLMASTLVDSIK